MMQYTDIVSTQVEAKLSASMELSHWIASVLSAAAYRFVNTNAMLLAATLLSCLLGTIVYYHSKAVSQKSISTPEITAIETSKIASKVESTPLAIAKPTESADGKDDFPDIDLVPTDDIESDTDSSEQDDQDDWNEETYKETFSSLVTNNVVNNKDDNDADSNNEEEDLSDEEYKKKSPSPKPVVTRRKATKTANSSATTTANTRSKTAAHKKETLAQMRKRVAREMKESEERKRQASRKPVRWTPSKKPVRKETVAEMKARVAREFAAKLKK